MSSLAPFSKALGALLGALTPAVVMAILAAVHITAAPALIGLLCTVFAAVGAYLAPANAPAASAQHAAGGDVPPAPPAK